MVRILDFEGRSIELRYFQTIRFGRGKIYSTEVRLSRGDKIIIDGDTPWRLENKLLQLLPVSIHSRRLVKKMKAGIRVKPEF